VEMICAVRAPTAPETGIAGELISS
jgi:hypothetical protein